MEGKSKGKGTMSGGLKSDRTCAKKPSHLSPQSLRTMRAMLWLSSGAYAKRARRLRLQKLAVTFCIGLVLALVAVGGMALTSCSVYAQNSNQNRLSVGFGVMYERGLDVTVAYEHETSHHSAWEYFANGYLKWRECPTCGHVCPDSFWHYYNTYCFGAAYKPCISRGRNNYGNVRIGLSLGSNTDDVIAGFHLGLEHNYCLRGGWQLYWQVKTDLVFNGKDLFRTGVVLGFKLPL